jgi:ankyrin repeat protein
MTKEDLKAAFATSIEENRLNRFVRLFEAYVDVIDSARSVLQVDDAIVTIQGVTPSQVSLSALAYSIRLGRLEFIKYLVEEARSSLAKVCEALATVKKTPLDVICENGQLVVLKYLLPKLDGIKPTSASEPDEHEDESIFAAPKQIQARTHDQLRLLNNTYTAVQRAAEKGHTEVIKYLFTYYKAAGNPPLQCDINHIDEASGENCALLAAKSGSMELLVFLFYEAKADFFILNKRRESALQLAVLGSKRAPKVSYLPVVKFLCEKVGIDITYEYEETLLLVEDRTIVAYLQQKLDSRGISVSKSQIEAKFSARYNGASETTRIGRNTILLKELRDELSADLSSIPIVEDSLLDTPLSIWA